MLKVVTVAHEDAGTVHRQGEQRGNFGDKAFVRGFLRGPPDERARPPGRDGQSRLSSRGGPPHHVIDGRRSGGLSGADRSVAVLHDIEQSGLGVVCGGSLFSELRQSQIDWFGRVATRGILQRRNFIVVLHRRILPRTTDMFEESSRLWITY